MIPPQEVSQAVPARVVREPDEREQRRPGAWQLRHLLGVEPNAFRQLKAAQLWCARLQTVQRVVGAHLTATNEVQRVQQGRVVQEGQRWRTHAAVGDRAGLAAAVRVAQCQDAAELRKIGYASRETGC